MRPSTPERRLLASVLVLALFLVAACQSGTTESAVPAAPATSVPQTTAPPATIHVEVVEACAAGDEPLVRARVADLGGHMVADEDGLWIARFGSPEVIRVDAATMCPGEPVLVDGADLGIAAMALGDNGVVYVAAAQSGRVSAILPGETTAIPIAPEAMGGGGVAVADGRLWAICCAPGGAAGPSGVYDVASGELLAELDIASGTAVQLVGEVGWIGRGDGSGLYQVTWQEDGDPGITEFDGFGASTGAVAASEDGVYMVGDEPVLQRWVDGQIEEFAVLPFPRQRPIDIDIGPDGSVYAVGAFGPGVIWVKPDATAFSLVGAEGLIGVEAVGRWIWAIDTGGTLTRIDREILEGG